MDDRETARLVDSSKAVSDRALRYKTCLSKLFYIVLNVAPKRLQFVLMLKLARA